MANKYEFDMEKIARLVEEEDMTYKEVKEEIGTEAHHKTIGRHYRKWKEEQEGKKVKEAVNKVMTPVQNERYVCKECGKEFKPGKGYTTQDFCSKECFNDFYNNIPGETKEKAEKAISRAAPPEPDEDLEREAGEIYSQQEELPKSPAKRPIRMPFSWEQESREPSLWERFKDWFNRMFIC